MKTQRRNTLLGRRTATTVTLGLLLSVTVSAQTLPLEGYLQQVKQKHTGYKGSQLVSQGAVERSVESDLLFLPSFLASAGYSRDKAPAAPTEPADLKVQFLTGGLRQQTRFGLGVDLSYSLSKKEAFAVSGYEGKPTLGVSMPFWQNGFGRSVRATEELLEAQALASGYGESFRLKLILAEAENTYWRLALVRENVEVQKDTLVRAQRIRDWNQRRVQLQLSDRIDLLQADAALESRKLDLQAAMDEQQAAARAFNTLRGESQDAVEEALTLPKAEVIDGMSAPRRAELRDDVKAAKELARLADANATVGREKLLPKLDLRGSVSFSGTDASAGSAVKNSFKTDRPEYSAALEFSVPLAFGTTSDSRAGYAKEQLGAELKYERQYFEQEREWNDLQNRLGEAKKRLQLARSIEQAQREKVLHERDRHTRGRTTTFQVLQFEQEYAFAQLAHIRAQSDVLRIIAQMKTFGDAQ